MRVLAIRRYPVKSLGGSTLDAARVTDLGIEFDRAWGIVDVATGMVLTARREPTLLSAVAEVVDGAPRITTADGTVLAGSGHLSEWLGRPVALTRAGPEGGVYENPGDPETESDWTTWRGPGGAWHDNARTRLSLVSTDTLSGADPRRFRMNIQVSGSGEDDLVGRRIAIGDVGCLVTKTIGRCVMVTRPQPGLPRDLEVLRWVKRERGGQLGVGLLVETPGVVAVGDRVEVLG